MRNDKENELTEKEKEEIAQLKVGFNVIPESKEASIQAADRVEVSRKWAGKLLRLSFFLNIVSIICFVISALFLITKPSPSFYASTPSGKVYGPLPKIHLK